MITRRRLLAGIAACIPTKGRHVKPTDEFATIVAGTVEASAFTLVDSSGNDIADLGTALGFPAMVFHHNPLQESDIVWSRAGVGPDDGEQFYINGPHNATMPRYAQLILYQNATTDTGQAQLLSGAGENSINLGSNFGGINMVAIGTINFGPTTGLLVNGRNGYVAADNRNVAAGLGTALPNGGPFTIVAGCTFTINGLKVGDIVALWGASDITGVAGGIAQVATFMDGVQQSVTGVLQGAIRATIAIPPISIGIAVAGAHTFDLRGFTFGAGVANTNPGTTVLQAIVYATT